MLWGTSGRCQMGKVWGYSQEVLLVMLEGLWTQVPSTWTIYRHTAVFFSLVQSGG